MALKASIGGDAGHRRGEIIALEGTDVDPRRGLLTVEGSERRARSRKRRI